MSSGMAQVVVVGKIHSSGLEVFKRRNGLDVRQLSSVDEQAMRKAAAAADAILIRTSKLSREAIEGARQLKVVARHGVGYDNIDLAALTAKRIPLALVGNVNASSVAE